MSRTQIVLVTGCSFGMGTNIAMKYATDPRKCYKVWAAVRVQTEDHVMKEMAGDYLDKSLFICEIDLSNKDSIISNVNKIIETDGRIDILVNNAVCNYFCPFEKLDMDSGRRTMEVNFFGHARIMHMVLPGMKERRHGRIINIGSIGAIAGNALFSEFFVASKCAMESLSDTLNSQTRTYNVWLSVVQPAAVRTKNPMKVLVSRDYGDTVRFHDVDDVTSEMFKSYLDNLNTSYSSEYAQEPEEVACLIKDISETKEPLALYQTSTFGTYAAATWLKDTTAETGVKLMSESLGV